MTKNWMWVLLIVIIVVAWYSWKSGSPAISNTTTNRTVNSTTNLSTAKSTPEAVVSGEIIQSAVSNLPEVAGDAGEATLINSMSQWVGDLNQSYNETTF